MDNCHYFKKVVTKLTYEDIGVLATLCDTGADSTLTAIRKTQLASNLQLSRYRIDQITYRLVGMCLTEFANGTQNTHLYITDLGTKVIEDTLQREEV